MEIIELLLHTVLGMAIAVALGWLHEFLHMYAAIRLGYKVNNINLRMNETDIDITEDDPNFKKIALAPYYVNFPLAILLVVVGIYLNFLGIIIGGVATILLHSVTVWVEGKDLKKTLCDVDEYQSESD